MYRTFITYEVLSREPLGCVSLRDIDHLCTEGDCSGAFKETIEERVDHPTMMRLLDAQQSDPLFLSGLEDGDECPNCGDGTIEFVEDEARCMGECGQVWSIDSEAPLMRPMTFAVLYTTGRWDERLLDVPVQVRREAAADWVVENRLQDVAGVCGVLLMHHDDES